MYTAAHNKSCVQKGPCGQFFRLRGIFEKNEDFINECELLIHHYLKKRYPKKQLLHHFCRANRKNKLLLEKDNQLSRT